MLEWSTDPNITTSGPNVLLRERVPGMLFQLGPRQSIKTRSKRARQQQVNNLHRDASNMTTAIQLTSNSNAANMTTM